MITVPAVPNSAVRPSLSSAGDAHRHGLAARIGHLGGDGALFRKLLVATLYARRWLSPPAPAVPAFSPRVLGWLEPLADWQPIPSTALASAS